MQLQVIPIELDEANIFIQSYHRHHGKVQGHKFSVAAFKPSENRIVGVATIGRPVSRFLDDGTTLEVTRLCVIPDADKKDCTASFLYGASRRATFALGYKRLITYTLKTESGESLRGAGWKCLGEAGGGTWNRKDRPRIDKHPLQRKWLWEILPTPQALGREGVDVAS